MDQLSHVAADGTARMVDISAKNATLRKATACATVRTTRAVILAIEENRIAKGDVLSTARIAGIMAAKRVDELIPLCHSLSLSSVSVDFEIEENEITAVSTVTTNAQTGVEMEALTAVTVAALTIYDMAKAMDKRMEITNMHLLTKTGGKSGDFKW